MGQIYEYDNEGFTFVVSSFNADYAGCGSHQIELSLAFDIETLNSFLAQLGIPPLKPVAAFPPKVTVQLVSDNGADDE